MQVSVYKNVLFQAVSVDVICYVTVVAHLLLLTLYQNCLLELTAQPVTKDKMFKIMQRQA